METKNVIVGSFGRRSTAFRRSLIATAVGAFAAILSAWFLAGTPAVFAANGGLPCLRNFDSLWIVTGDYLVQASHRYMVATTRIDAHAMAIAIDDGGGRIWRMEGNELKATTYDGQQVVSVDYSEDPPTYAVLAVDASDGSLWVASSEKLSLFDAGGVPVTGSSAQDLPDGDVIALTADYESQTVWAAGRTWIQRVGRDGEAIVTVDELYDVASIDWDNRAKRLWVATQDSLIAYDSDGQVVESSDIAGGIYVSTVQDGGSWVATATNVVRVGEDGSTTYDLEPDVDAEPFLAIEANPLSGAATAITANRIVFITTAGTATVFSTEIPQSGLAVALDSFSPPDTGTAEGAGVTMRWDGAYWRVASVWYDSPAEDAGIQVNDKILSINDVIYPTPVGSSEEIRNALIATNEEVGEARTSSEDVYEIDRGGVVSDYHASLELRSALWRRALVTFLAAPLGATPPKEVPPERNSACYYPCKEGCPMDQLQGYFWCFSGAGCEDLKPDPHIEHEGTPGDDDDDGGCQPSCSGTCNEPSV